MEKQWRNANGEATLLQSSIANDHKLTLPKNTKDQMQRSEQYQETDRNYHGSKSAIEIDILLENKMIVNVFATSDLKSTFFTRIS